MTTIPPNNSDAQSTPDNDQDALLQQLRRKQGGWVDWGQACQTLQKAGYSPQKIFEETGFEPIQQNQIIVAAQVYGSIEAADAAEGVRSHFRLKGSDILYELRILTQTDRAVAAELVLEKNIDVEEVREVAKALREFSYRNEPPEGFSDNPGDAVAYHYWQLARQKSDLQARSRLIAQGLRFAHSESARQQIEKLLTDFSVVKSRPAPNLPIYRLESESEVPYIIPVAGQFPLPVEDYNAVPVSVPEAPFGIVKFSGTGAWAPVPGWQVILQAEDPIALLGQSDQLPKRANDQVEPVLIVADRSQREWNADSYFLFDHAGTLQMKWFEEAPQSPLLGRIILILRPKRILDENVTMELWHVDE